MKKYQNFLSENFHVLVVEFSVYLNGHGSTRPVTNSAPKSTRPRVNLACFVGYTNTLSEHTYLFNYSLINIYFMT